MHFQSAPFFCLNSGVHYNVEARDEGDTLQRSIGDQAQLGQHQRSAVRVLPINIVVLRDNRGLERSHISGFAERDSKPFLAVIPKDGDRRFLDPMRWFYCGADSDLDSLA